MIHGVNYKDDNAAALKWLADFHNPYQLNIRDEQGSLGLDLGVYGAPETFLIDAKGIIRYKHVGVVDATVWREQLAPLYRGWSMRLSHEALACCCRTGVESDGRGQGCHRYVSVS